MNERNELSGTSPSNHGENKKYSDHIAEFNTRVPDAALWIDTDALSDPPLGLGITLSVRGRLITGKAATVDEWAHAIKKLAGVDSEHLFSAGVEITRLRLTEARSRRKAAREAGEFESLTEEEKIDSQAYSSFLHLVDAQFVLDGSDRFLPSSTRLPMRIRYDSIDAWTYGFLSGEDG